MGWRSPRWKPDRSFDREGRALGSATPFSCTVTLDCGAIGSQTRYALSSRRDGSSSRSKGQSGKFGYSLWVSSVPCHDLINSYGGIRSKHPTLAARAALDAARRVSAATHRPMDEDEEDAESSLGFAQKFLLGGFCFCLRTDYEPTKRTRSTSMIYGSLQLLPRTMLSLMTRKRKTMKVSRMFRKTRTRWLPLPLRTGQVLSDDAPVSQAEACIDR